MWRRYGAPMIEPTVLRGFSDAKGSWKIICISRRSPRRSPPLTLRDVLALELDRPLGRVVQAHEHASERRLAAPRLPHQAHRLALEDVQVDTVHRVDVADPLLEQDASGDRETACGGRGSGRVASRTSPGPAETARSPRRSRARHHLFLEDALLVREREVTPRRVVTVGRQELGHVRPAPVEHVGAARVERAARRHEDQRRRETSDRDAAAPSCRSRPAVGSTTATPRCTGGATP